MNHSSSPRQQDFHTTRPPYPQLSSSSSTASTSSVFQSSSSLDSLQSMMSVSSHNSRGFSAAPLPSPSAGVQTSSYFAPFAQTATQTTLPAQSQPAQDQRYSQQTQIASQHHLAGQRGNGGGAPITAPFLQDFNLVAEAAKRAEMAILTRDLGDVGL